MFPCRKEHRIDVRDVPGLLSTSDLGEVALCTMRECGLLTSSTAGT